jgi:RNA polymerase primary sigma factor
MSNERDGGRRAPGYRGSLDAYLRSIRRYRFLTTSGEYRLVREEEGGGEVWREKLVEANLRFVVKIARSYRRFGTPVEDLISEGNIGLIEAARRFDPSRGVRFSSYAAWYIRKYMISALVHHQTQNSVPEPVAPGETSASRRAKGTRPRRQKLVSLDDFTSDPGDRSLSEKRAATNGDEPEALILQHELAEAIRTVLPKLPSVERRILVAHYGLDGEPPLTLQEIGRALGYTRERVRQIEVRGLARARRLLLSSRIDPR